MAKTLDKMRKTTQEYPSPYVLRSPPYGDSETVGLRFLADSFLKLEYQLNAWRRHTFRRLDRIENRLRQCENALALRNKTSTTITKPGTVNARKNAAHAMPNIDSTHSVKDNAAEGPNHKDLNTEEMVHKVCREMIIEEFCTPSGKVNATVEDFSAKDKMTMETDKSKSNGDNNDSHGLTPDVKESQTSSYEDESGHDDTMMKPQRYLVCGMSTVAECSPPIQEPRKPDFIACHTPKKHLSDSIDNSRLTSPPDPAQQMGGVLTKSASDSSRQPRLPKLQRTLIFSPEAPDRQTECPTSPRDRPPAEENTFGHALAMENAVGKFHKTATVGRSINSVPVARPIYVVPQNLYSSEGEADEVDNFDGEQCHASNTCESIEENLVIDPPPPFSAWKRALELVHADWQKEHMQKKSSFTISFSLGAPLDVSSSNETDCRE